jgi:ribonuclease J
MLSETIRAKLRVISAFHTFTENRMTINITAIGGYGEIGRNCTAVDVNGDVVLIDLGLHLDHYIKYTEDEDGDVAAGDPEILMRVGAIPDLRVLKESEKNVKAIVLGHAHLDHIGAAPFLIERFKHVPIYGTAFTIALLRQLLLDKDIHPAQPLRVLKPGQRSRIGDNMELELIPITHSTPDSAIVALHTAEGTVLYANDFKLDNHPTLGFPLNLKPFEALQGNVVALISECLNAPHATKTPSEAVAREMLREVLLETKTTKKAVFVTTFSSHIARLKSIVEVAQALDRKPVFLGRSLTKYLTAAKEAGVVDLLRDSILVKHGSQARRFLKNLENPERYVLIVTGHQGEPKAMLSRMVDENLFKFQPEDIIVFSCNVIPVPMIQANRKVLEEKLKKLHLRVFSDVHVSGHASREDLREFLDTVQPAYVIPSHGDPIMTSAYVELAGEQGFENKRVFPMREGDTVTIPSITPKAAFPTLPADFEWKDPEVREVKRVRNRRGGKGRSRARSPDDKAPQGRGPAPTRAPRAPQDKASQPRRDGPLDRGPKRS